MLIRSQILGDMRHGFPTRDGGVSTGRYASMNLGGKWGDDPELVSENRRRLAAEGEFDLERLRTARQVHGAVALRVGDERVDEAQADALVTDVAGIAVGVFTADCVPVLLAHDSGRIVAAAHAGWRGAVGGILGATVAAMASLGARAEHIRAALGPSICARCFEVGDEVATQFDPRFVIRTPGRKPHVDLHGACRAFLVGAGLRPENIDASPPCTMCDPSRFFSYRRDGGQIGQHLSFIAAAA